MSGQSESLGFQTNSFHVQSKRRQSNSYTRCLDAIAMCVLEREISFKAGALSDFQVVISALALDANVPVPCVQADLIERLKTLRGFQQFPMASPALA